MMAYMTYWNLLLYHSLIRTPKMNWLTERFCNDHQKYYRASQLKLRQTNAMLFRFSLKYDEKSPDPQRKDLGSCSQ